MTYIGATYTVKINNVERFYAQIKGSKVYKERVNNKDRFKIKGKIYLKNGANANGKDRYDSSYQSVPYPTPVSEISYSGSPSQDCWYPSGYDYIMVFSYLNEDWTYRDQSKWYDIGIAGVKGNNVAWLHGKAIKQTDAANHGGYHVVNHISYDYGFIRLYYNNSWTYCEFAAPGSKTSLVYDSVVVQHGPKNGREKTVYATCCYIIGKYPKYENDVNVGKIFSTVSITSDTDKAVKFYTNISNRN